MVERPILFSGAMVRAILDGRKTQTRRICKQATNVGDQSAWGVYPAKESGWIAWFGVPDVTNGAEFTQKAYDHGFPCPYGNPGDRLWVREQTWAWGKWVPNGLTKTGRKKWKFSPVGDSVRYQEHPPTVTAKRNGECGWVYRHARYMPRKRSRITLEITDVRVQRLQEISKEDAIAEGAFFTDYGRRCFHRSGPPGDVGDCTAPAQTHPQREGWSMVPTASSGQCLHDPQMAFANLWNSINAKRGFGWDSNPWVWALTFRRVTA